MVVAAVDSDQRPRRRQRVATPTSTRAETIVDGSGVLVAAGGRTGAGGFNDWSAAGGAVTGTWLGGGGEHALVEASVPASCQADTAGGADATIAAAAGCVTGDGVSAVVGAVMVGINTAVAGIVGAVVGVSGGTGGTRLVGFRI